MPHSLSIPLADVLTSRTAAKISKAFGYEKIEDLLYHLPRKYITRGKFSPFILLEDGDNAVVAGQVVDISVTRGRKGVRVRINDLYNEMQGAQELFVTNPRRRPTLDLIWYNQLWPMRVLSQNAIIVAWGTYSKDAFIGAEFKVFGYANSKETKQSAYRYAKKVSGQIEPVYSAVAGLQSYRIAKIIELALSKVPKKCNLLDERIYNAFFSRGDWSYADPSLGGYTGALHAVHRPLCMNDAERGMRFLKRFEALEFAMALAIHSHNNAVATKRPSTGEMIRKFDTLLPFALTQDQQKASSELSRLVDSTIPMKALLHGEVGSGKTVVALRLMLQIAETGGQCVILAPTEVLAHQHFVSFSKMLNAQLRDTLDIVVMVGSDSKRHINSTLMRIANGSAKIIIATHTILQEGIAFCDLGLVVVDEQHRFGVEQRQFLLDKSASTPHMLVLSATPIPRTVAMTIFGDLSIHSLRALPAGRKKVSTYVFNPIERPNWWDRLWQKAAEECASGRGVFVVCSEIGKDSTKTAHKTQTAQKAQNLQTPEETDLNFSQPISVIQMLEYLHSLPHLQRFKIDTLHGKTPPQERDDRIQDFSIGKINILVATTIVEVGIDIPNATMMIIMNAERFGMAQLHQMRGRIGRGSHPGTCILISTMAAGTPSAARMNAIASTQDGFALAEKDLEIRGEGDILSLKQSGFKSSFRVLSILKDIKTIQEAKNDVEKLFSTNKRLLQSKMILERAQRFSSQECYISAAH